jgi:hypothetical protein
MSVLLHMNVFHINNRASEDYRDPWQLSRLYASRLQIF